MLNQPKDILLDTSVAIAHLRGNINVLALANNQEELFLPLVALGELYKGALASHQPEYNRRKVDNFLLIAGLLNPDLATADAYAYVSVQLKCKGTPIPENDIWIAALALECNMPLATRDQHFKKVDRLQLLFW